MNLRISYSIMKKIVIVLLACLPMFALGQEKKKIEIKPYGFFKGDMVYATAGVYSWGNNGNTYLSAPQFAGDVEENAMGFTAQHSRFGVNISREGTNTVGGKVEIDFYGGAFDANGNETKMDYYKLMQIVKDSGYKGFVDVEYEGSELSERDGIIATKKLLEKVFESLG